MLNLLPSEEKTNLQKARIYLLLRNYLVIILIFTISLTAILWVSRNILKRNYEEVLRQGALVEKKYKPLNQEINQINSKLQTLKQIQTKFIKWTEILAHLSQMVPPETSINSLIFNGEEKAFNLSGEAKMRSQYLEFEKNLRQSKVFLEVISPLSNLLQRENVEFSFRGKLNL